MWIWSRFASPFDTLRTVQREFISCFEDWRSRGIVGRVVSTYRGEVAVQGNLPVLVNGNLYVCLELLGINEDSAIKDIELSENEIEQISLDVHELIKKLAQRFNLPVDYKGGGISDSTYDHLSNRNYRRALEQDSYRAGFPSNWNTESILELVSRGTGVGLKYYERVLLKNDVRELISLAQEIQEYVNSMNDLDTEQMVYCFHIASHTIPKVWFGMIDGRAVGGFIDRLLSN